MTWAQELTAMWEASRGSAAFFCALVALRLAERGGPGNEFGVLSILAVDTYPEELATAVTSFKNHIGRCRAQGMTTHDASGYMTEAFLRSFSARWAPTVGATNDPNNLNRHHAPNLLFFYREARTQLAQKATELLPSVTVAT